MTFDTACEALDALRKRLQYWAAPPVFVHRARAAKAAMEEIASEAEIDLSIYLPPIPQKRALVPLRAELIPGEHIAMIAWPGCETCGAAIEPADYLAGFRDCTYCYEFGVPPEEVVSLAALGGGGGW